MPEIEHWVLVGGMNVMGDLLVSAEPFEGPRIPDGESVEVVRAEQLREALEALRVADDLLRRFSISANDHSELIRREFGKAQEQINDALREQSDA